MEDSIVVRLQARAALGGAFGTAVPVAGFKGEGVALRERADVGCVFVTAAVDSTLVLRAASVAVGVELPSVAGLIGKAVGRTALWLSPRSWLVQCSVQDEVALVGGVNGAFPDRLVHAARFSDALCWLALSGPRARDLLTEGGFLSLERGGLAVGHVKRTLIAQIAAVVVRESENAWLVGVERSRARYFTQWLSAVAA